MGRSILGRDGFKRSFTLLTILLIPVSIAINIVGAQLNKTLGLPFYLDTIGTVFSGMICGPWLGGTVGLLTNVVRTIIEGRPQILPFAVVSVAVGVTTGLLSYKRFFLSPVKLFIAIIIISLVTIITATPIVLMVYGGATGSNSDAITAILINSGKKIITSVLSTQLITNGLDRIISVLVSYLLIKSVSKRFISKLPLGHIYLKEIEVVDED